MYLLRLTDYPVLDMHEHIREVQKNAEILFRQPDSNKAFQETFDEADVVYAVWAGWKAGDAEVCGCSLEARRRPSLGLPGLLDHVRSMRRHSHRCARAASEAS